MLLKNLDPNLRLVNGARGTVLRFAPARAVPDVRSSPQPAQGVAAELAAALAAEEDGQPPPSGLYPVVGFEGGVERLLTPEEWTIEQGGRVIARRVQVSRRPNGHTSARWPRLRSLAVSSACICGVVFMLATPLRRPSGGSTLTRRLPRSNLVAHPVTPPPRCRSGWRGPSPSTSHRA